MKCLENMNRLVIDNEMLMKLLKLYEYKGKEYYYEAVFKSNMKPILKRTIERDTFYLGQVLGLDITKNRQKLLIKKDSKPKNKQEQILINIKETLKLVHETDKDFEFTTNEILYIGKRLYDKIEEISYRTTTVEVQHNLLVEKKRESLRKNMEELLKKYGKLVDSGKYEITQLVTNFYIDFINLKPFNAHNEIISLFAIFTLLFKEKFTLFKFNSFFEIFYENKDEFNQKTIEANFNWELGFSDTTGLNKLLVDMLLQEYIVIDKMAKNQKFDQNVKKSYAIENAILKIGEVFTKDEIREKFPLISESTIDRTLKRMKEENKIRPNGTGRSATWLRLQNIEKFEPVPSRQLSLYDIMMEGDEE